MTPGNNAICCNFFFYSSTQASQDVINLTKISEKIFFFNWTLVKKKYNTNNAKAIKQWVTHHHHQQLEWVQHIARIAREARLFKISLE
jgi:hypothetical protein